MRLIALAGLLVVLAGCASQESFTPTGAAVELDAVPFFPQQRYQCGPAALATVLAYSGVKVQPDELVPLVYVPARKGSFQLEIKAATRSYGRLPYELDAEPAALFAEVAAGNPVLILQNLGLDWLPRWHYAVGVGYDPQRKEVVLRSGTRERQVDSVGFLLRTWAASDRWAMLALRPGELPVTASAERYVAMIAASEALVDAAALTAALDAGLRRWPDDATLAFAAGNHARATHDLKRAATLYRAALTWEPDHLGALNNYADLLLAEDCLASAAAQAAKARGLVDPQSSLYPVVADTVRAVDVAVAARGAIDQGPTCTALIAE